MAEKFRETDKAVSYLASGLKSDYPDAAAEVILVRKSHPVTETCRIEDIGPVLTRLSKGFRSTTVAYHPENPYGFVAEMRAADNSEDGTHRKRERPRLVVLLTEVGGRAFSTMDAPAGYRVADEAENGNSS